MEQSPFRQDNEAERPSGFRIPSVNNAPRKGGWPKGVHRKKRRRGNWCIVSREYPLAVADLLKIYEETGHFRCRVFSNLTAYLSRSVGVELGVVNIEGPMVGAPPQATMLQMVTRGHTWTFLNHVVLRIGGQEGPYYDGVFGYAGLGWDAYENAVQVEVVGHPDESPKIGDPLRWMPD